VRFASPETYTPKHLAEKILTSKSALEGERKQVTVLFADLKLWDPPATNEDAIDQLRFKASRLGANGIAQVFCDSGGEFDLGKNCWSSVKCRGTAIEVPP
jgi:uncharacterized protein YbjQ (UPF0145 family)